jgi:hypothetical protein
VFADAFGEEKLLRDHAFSQFLCTLRGFESYDRFLVFPHESIASERVRTGFRGKFISALHRQRKQEAKAARSESLPPKKNPATSTSVAPMWQLSRRSNV